MQRVLVATAMAAMAAVAFSGCLNDDASGQGADGEANRLRGGLGPGTIPIAEGWSEAALQGGDGHDHRDPGQHKNLSTPNFEVIGWDPLITDYYGRTAGGYFCGDTQETDDRALSVVHSWVSDVAMIVSDVTDPLKPQKIGELAMANTHVYDLTMTPDQRYVLLATSPGGVGPDDPTAAAAPQVTWRDACTGEQTVLDGPEAGLPFASGIVLVDMANPRVPAIVDFMPFPVNGGHSVQAEEMGGRMLVLVSVPNPGASYYALAEIDAETPNGGKLVPLSYYQYNDLEQTPPIVTTSNLHDGYLQTHPVTGQDLAYLAYGSTGLVILDVTDPMQPEFLSHWADWGVVGEAAPTNPFVHEALPMEETWDGRHYTFFGEECGGARPNTPTCLAFVLDTTDPADPQFVGAWTLPHEVEWSGGLQYSLHYLAVANGTLFLTNYHGGLWAVDVSTDEARRTMPAIGVFMPDRVSPKPIGGAVAFDYTPVILDLNVLSDGTLVVYDGTSGLYTVRFHPENPAPSPAPWPLGYNE